MLGALAQGIGPTGVGRFANVDTGAILAILLLLAISVTSTAWQTFATLAYFSPILTITVLLAHWLFWQGIKISKKHILMGPNLPGPEEKMGLQKSPLFPFFYDESIPFHKKCDF